jgi:hypothetical protein
LGIVITNSPEPVVTDSPKEVKRIGRFLTGCLLISITFPLKEIDCEKINAGENKKRKV